MKHPEAALRAYRDLLVAEPVSVTSVRDPADAWDLHVSDALTGLDLIQRLSSRSVIDVGSGGGSPGIPIAIAAGVDVTLLEASAAKCDFLRRTVATLGLECPIVHGRSEELGRTVGRDAYGLALARALAPPAVAVELCLPLVRVGGHVLLWTADTDTGALEHAAVAVGGSLIETVAVRPNRYLMLLEKALPTPQRFPRRPGMAAKRPLGRVRSRT